MGTIDPGEGFRLLVEGDPIPSVVDYCFDGEWIPRRADHHVGECWSPRCYLPMRVKIAPQNNVHTGGPYVSIEVHRAALAEIERLKAELDTRCDIWRLARDVAAEERDAAEKEVKRLKAQLDAVKQPQPDPEPEWFDLTPFGEHVWRPCDEAFLPSCGQWRTVYMACAVGASISEMRRVGYTQFRCLLKDAPPELVAKAKQTESPDDWVTQDRVPCRPNIDEIRWDDKIVSSVDRCVWITSRHGNISDGKMHGYALGPRDVLSVRCRRRDLPPMPQPKPKAEREVSLYWYDGNVVGRYADCPPTDPSFVPLIVRDGKVFIETETRDVVR